MQLRSLLLYFIFAGQDALGTTRRPLIRWGHNGRDERDVVGARGACAGVVQLGGSCCLSGRSGPCPLRTRRLHSVEVSTRALEACVLSQGREPRRRREPRPLGSARHGLHPPAPTCIAVRTDVADARHPTCRPQVALGDRRVASGQRARHPSRPRGERRTRALLRCSLRRAVIPRRANREGRRLRRGAREAVPLR